MADHRVAGFISVQNGYSSHDKRVEAFRVKITQRYSTILKLENRTNNTQIENLRVMSDLEDLIQVVVGMHRNFPTLLPETKSSTSCKSQTKILLKVRNSMKVLTSEWLKFERKFRKHQKACDDHTYERNQAGIDRAVMWNQCLQVDSLKKLELILAYFECQRILYPPVALGDQLREMWDGLNFERRTMDIIQDLNQLDG